MRSCTVLLSTVLACQPVASIAQENVKSLRYGDMSGTISGLNTTSFTPHGPLTMRYGDGKNALNGAFVNGQPNGRWQRWYPDGQLFGEYSYGSGVLDGVVEQYWDNGSLARLGHYSRGFPSGQLLFFAPDGRLTKRMFFASKQNRRLGATFYRFICVVQSDRTRCKSIDDIRRDLSTIVAGNKVEALLADINSIYDNLGLDATADVLTSCADGRLAAFHSAGALASGGPHTSGGAPVGVAPSFGNPLASTPNLSDLTASAFSDLTASSFAIGAISDLATSSCRGSDNGSRGAAAGQSGDADRAGRDAVNHAVKIMDASAQECHQSSMEGFVGGLTPGAGGQMSIAELCGNLCIAIVGAAIGGAIAGLAINAIMAAMSDGYVSDGQPMGDGKTKYAAKDDPSGYKIDDQNNLTTTFHTETADTTTDRVVYDGTKLDASKRNFITMEWTTKDKTTGNVVEHGVVMSPPKSSEGYSVENSDIVETVIEKTNPDGTKTTTDTTENKVSGYTATTPRAAGPAPWTPVPSTRPTGGDATMPADRDEGSSCANARQAWQRFKALCDAADWQTYVCQKLVASLNGCPDPALVLITPDGDGVCAAWSGTFDVEKENCERKKGIMIPSGDPGDRAMCDKPDVHQPATVTSAELGGPISGDPCLDPRAMCRPDAMLGLDEMSRVAPQP